MNILKFYRVRDWIKNLGIPLIGIMSVRLDISSIFFSMALSSLCLAYAFSFNDIFDKKIKGSSQLVLSLFPALIALFISFFLSIKLILVILAFITLFGLYSIRPIRLKRYWFFSLPINTICLGVLLFLLGYFFVSSEFNLISLTFLTVYSSFIFSSEIIHQISHKKEDKKNGISSFPITFGSKISLKLFELLQLSIMFFVACIIFFDIKSNFIFFPAIFFSFLRFVKIKSLNSKDTNFSKLREGLYGVYEGLSYFLIILFKTYTFYI